MSGKQDYLAIVPVGIVVDRCLNLGKTTCVMFLYTSVGEGSIELLRFTWMQSCSLDPSESSGYEGHESAVNLCCARLYAL